MFLNVNRHFIPVQTHFLASLGSTIESGNYDSGQIHSQSQIEAAGATAGGHAFQTSLAADRGCLLAVDQRFYSFPSEAASAGNGCAGSAIVSHSFGRA